MLPEGETILMTAARTGRPEVLEAPPQHGADINAREHWFGETALIWAAAENHADAVHVLARHGADVNARSKRARRAASPQRPVDSAARQLDAADVRGAAECARRDARADRESGADMNTTDPDGATALVLAIINANYDEPRRCSSRRAPIRTSATRKPRWPPSMRLSTCIVWPSATAARTPSRQAARCCRCRSRTSSRTGRRSQCPLSAPLLQRHHTAGDRALGDGSTPFMRAAKSGDVAVMRLLLAAAPIRC